MNFADAAVQICGQSAALLGWRPAEFWNATPAELACILNAMGAQGDAPPDADSLKQLMKQFPDNPSGGD